jgi:hypothetical protein
MVKDTCSVAILQRGIFLRITIRKIVKYAIPSCSALNETNKTYLNIKIDIGSV